MLGQSAGVPCSWVYCLEPKQRLKIWKPQPSYLLQSALLWLVLAAATFEPRSDGPRGRPFQSRHRFPAWTFVPFARVPTKRSPAYPGCILGGRFFQGFLVFSGHLWLTVSTAQCPLSPFLKRVLAVKQYLLASAVGPNNLPKTLSLFGKDLLRTSDSHQRAVQVLL